MYMSNRFKALLAFCFTFFVISCGQDQPLNTGPVATVTSFNSSGEKTRLERYDKEGRNLEEISYYNDGTVDNVVSYTYNAQGLLTEKLDTSMGDRYLYVYDGEGRLVSEINEELSGKFETRSTYLNEGLVRIDSSDRHSYVSIYHLNADGRTIKWMKLNGNRDTTDHAETVYDDHGNKVGYTSYSNGRFYNQKKYIYDAAGNEIEELILNQDGSIDKKYVNTYDDDGRLSKIEQIGADGSSSFTISYTYKGDTRTCHSAIPGMKSKTTKKVYTYHGS